MLNSQLQHHPQASSQQQLHQLHTTDNGNTNGYFIFDDLTTALQEQRSQQINDDHHPVVALPSSIHQLQYRHQSLQQQHQPQQNSCFGELLLSKTKTKKHKQKITQNACKLRLLLLCQKNFATSHQNKNSRFNFHRWINNNNNSIIIIIISAKKYTNCHHHIFISINCHHFVLSCLHFINIFPIFLNYT